MTALKNIPFSQEIPTADENDNMDLGDITLIVGEAGVPTCGAIMYQSEYTTCKIAGDEGVCISGTSTIVMKSSDEGLQIGGVDNAPMAYISGSHLFPLSLIKFRTPSNTVSSGMMFISDEE